MPLPDYQNIAVISDTHGLLRPEVLDKIRDVDLIIHAGDVGNEKTLETLQSLGKVAIVRGNVDRGAWADHLPMTEIVAVEHGTFYIVHDIDDLDIVPDASGIDGVIFGHSHKPLLDDRNGVLYLNPGKCRSETVFTSDLDGIPHLRRPTVEGPSPEL